VRHEFALTAALGCIACELILTSAGVFGLGALIQSFHWLKYLAGLGGSAFLYYFAWQTLQRAMKNNYIDPEIKNAPSRRAVLIMAASFSLLNPGVWLDTVVVIGGFSAQFGWPGALWFGAGSFLTATTWFLFVITVGTHLSALFARPGAWRWFDLFVFAMMIILATTLLWHTLAA
jgi:L-lysine exporter family protein LysE/ArgO